MLVAGGDQMLIEKYVFIDFKDFCKKHFKKNRESKSIEFLQALKSTIDHFSGPLKKRLENEK